jgi:hypothetical protein
VVSSTLPNKRSLCVILQKACYAVPHNNLLPLFDFTANSFYLCHNVKFAIA